MYAKRRHLVLEQIDTIARLHAWRAEARSAKAAAASVAGLVPTMGALHEGHAALIRAARRECETAIVSIFVNPLQFDKPEDLSRYPRTLEADLALCRDLGVDGVFVPSPDDMYPAPPECTVDVGRLADHLCGKFRPGHFRGVATVVLKLLQIVQPQRAYFGEKDAQQLAIINRMVADFNLPVMIVGVPTVREPDGLAMSSRNRHLTAEQRATAACLYRALVEARRLVASGERDAGAIKNAAVASIPQSDMTKLEYFEIVDPQDLQPVATIAGTVRVAGALWLGSTRLIDNVLADPTEARIRVASREDAPALARIINDAFIVEAFFKIGDRTSVEEVLELMKDGEFLIAGGAAGAMNGCVYLKCGGGRAYFGMLSIDPSKQGTGFGRLLIDAVEARARERGCLAMEIHIVNLREELPAYYRRLGYEERGTLPFSAPQRASRPCHFIVMTKELTKNSAH